MVDSIARASRRRGLGIVFIAVWTLAFGLIRPVAAAEGPRDVVQKTADTVVGILADKALSPDQKRAKIEDIATEHFDFVTLSRLVMARHWKELSSEQQSQFVGEFRRHLSLTYG